MEYTCTQQIVIVCTNKHNAMTRHDKYETRYSDMQQDKEGINRGRGLTLYRDINTHVLQNKANERCQKKIT